MPSPTSAFHDLSPYFLYLLILATSGPLLFGYHIAELNAPSEVITCSKKSIKQNALSRISSAIKDKVYSSSGKTQANLDTSLPKCIPMNATQFGTVSSIFTLGGLLGALAAGPISTKYGRLKTTICSAAVATVGSMLEAASPNIAIMAVGRFVSGLAAGTVLVVVPLYISEISPPARKGFFGSFTQVMTNVGILIAQVLGYFLSYGQMWRVILAIGGAIALAQGIALAVSGQESPRWLAYNGKPLRAKRILSKLRGREFDIDAEIASWGSGSVSRELEDEEETLLNSEDNTRDPVHIDETDNNVVTSPTASIQASHNTKHETLGFLAVIRHPHSAPAVFAVVMVMIAQQFTGINSIIMYGVSLLSDLLAANSALLNVAVSVLNVIVTASAAPMVDRLGRKTCLLVSITGMGVTSILLAIGIMRSISILSAVAVTLFVASFGTGLGPIPFILASELVDQEAMGATQSWALAANWIATFCVAQFFPIINEALGKGQVYFIFAAFALGFGAFIFWYVPETKGKASADEVWGRRKDTTRED